MGLVWRARRGNLQPDRLIGTAKLNGIDPEAHLRAVLERIADHSIKRIGELLPWHIVPASDTDSRLAA
jgi:hypothetical protein